MAIKAKNLRQEAKQNQSRMKEILDGSEKSLTKEQEEEFDKLDAEAETKLRQADKIERMEKLELETGESEEVETGVKGKSIDKLNPEEKAKAENLALRSFLQTGDVPNELRSLMPLASPEKDDNTYISKALKEMGIETKATQTTATTGGGYTIPRGFQAELEKALKAYGGMWETSRIVKTSKGNIIDWPTVNDTNRKAYLLAESVSAATSAAGRVRTETSPRFRR